MRWVIGVCRWSARVVVYLGLPTGGHGKLTFPMSELVFELGCEELPANVVLAAREQLAREIAEMLTEAGCSFGDSMRFATPRRLIVIVRDLPASQPDSVKEVRGPALKSAYQEDGTPTPALLGFCKGQGVDVVDLEKREEYVYAQKHTTGRSLSDLLAEILPAAVHAMTFPKTMRWGSARMRFARPIRWLVAIVDGAVVPFSIESVASGNKSRGHRFLSPEEFEVRDGDQFLKELVDRKVQPCPQMRAEVITDFARKLTDGKAVITEDLLAENAYLVEWPMPTIGAFNPEFMHLPESVLITAMAKHEKFFPIRGNDGKLTNRFISVRNGGEEETVRLGNEWVLNARFNDANFFYHEDQKKSFDEFLERTEHIIFQAGLGTVRQRADRLAMLCVLVVGSTDLADAAKNAGLYAKADLSTGLVSELASLQGVIGGEYARAFGLGDAVGHAIATHYSPAQNLPADTDAKKLGIALTLADQIDKLVGFLGLGLLPSGSSDPYGLRKAAQTMLDCEFTGSFTSFVDTAIEEYKKQGIVFEHPVHEPLKQIFLGRYENRFADERHDIVEAALAEGNHDVLNPNSIAARVAATKALAANKDFIQAAARPINIVAAALKKGITIPKTSFGMFPMADLESVEGVQLLESAKHTPMLETASVAQVLELQTPIHAFFESTMIMADDERIRTARLQLSMLVSDILLSYGDLTKIVVEG